MITTLKAVRTVAVEISLSMCKIGKRVNETTDSFVKITDEMTLRVGY